MQSCAHKRDNLTTQDIKGCCEHYSIPNLACSAGKHTVAPMPASAPAALYMLSVVSNIPLHFK